MSKEGNKTYQYFYFRGHTYQGNLSLLFQQPVASLKVQKVSTRTCVIDCGLPRRRTAVFDEGYLEPAFRWVIAPREDQAHLERIALCCVMRPSGKLLWKALDSPFLQKVNYRENTTENETEVLNIICDTVRVQLVTSASMWRQSIA
ncbi:Oxoglutarate/iron-dependent dioxygenase [Penicillium longicatenatum]|uniref:Oxoglutarate/iron-dependent dioxygenase n=1 Tax=Penicillium longicatenatum TaxID=1561947 RepID=UPI002546CE12|nr:Oxoglutarate/iron-dependent dioxygenase [Penicillium longicatenatum]KAJ5630717.1 Oxoglutarate/iron-dependent dioxygenase [Penicillium longicatenatum]